MDAKTTGGAAQKFAKEFVRASAKANKESGGSATMHDIFNTASQLNPKSQSNKILGAITSGGAFVKKAMTNDVGIKEAFNSVYKNAGGEMNWGNLAGTAFGVSAAARIASGGGVYRNSKGEVDLMGVPFV